MCIDNTKRTYVWWSIPYTHSWIMCIYHCLLSYHITRLVSIYYLIKLEIHMYHTTIMVRCRSRHRLVAFTNSIICIIFIHRLPRPIQQAVPTSIVSSTASIVNNRQHRHRINIDDNKQPLTTLPTVPVATRPSSSMSKDANHRSMWCARRWG